MSADEPKVLVCALSYQNHTVDSVLDTCDECQKKIWISLAGQEAIANGFISTKMCIPCSQKNQDDDTQTQILPSSFEELRANGAGDIADFLEWMQANHPEKLNEVLRDLGKSDRQGLA